jgi:hypothetical protein
VRRLFICLIVLATSVSCSRQKNLSEQLAAAISAHLNRIDQSAKLDSFHILWDVPVTPKLGRVIDDSVYVREYSRIKTQLASALAKHDGDSIDFYQYELNYMKKEIDSITGSIASGDTSKKFGYLIGCSYLIKLNDNEKADSTIIFVDSTYTMRYTEFVDSALKRIIAMIK